MSTHPAVWRLDGKSTTLVVVQDFAVPRLYWFGNKLAAELNTDQLLAHDDTALPHGELDGITPLSLFPQASTGYSGSAALNGHRAGRDFTHYFQTTQVERTANTLSIRLQDLDTGLQVDLELILDDDSDVVRMTTSLVNIADTPYTVDWLASATVPLPDHYKQCLTQHGRWGLENQAQRRPISPGRLDISNLHGRTSHEHAPGLICGTSDFNEDAGDVTYLQLAWSGNFSLRMEKLSNGDGSMQAGTLFLPGECILQAGEQLTTPSLIFTRGRGMNECTQRFHQYIRAAVLPDWTRKPRPVHANSWEALYFNHDFAELKPLIEAAAAAGAERFVLDDGWFLHRRSDNAGLGDWYVDKSIYPNGLQPVVNHVRQHGMQFGLWFEPEMVNPDSDLYRAHPDWALQVAHIETPLARNQLVLDIARPEVSNYLFERISSLVQEYAIDYIKWDQNRNLVLPGSDGYANAAAQPTALYQLMQRILHACPDLEIETCASGGARCDLGVLRYSGRVWTSDNIDPIDRTRIQQGFMRFMPPEIMGAHVGHEKAHLTGRATSLHTRAVVALQGQYGFELDARRLNETEMAALRHYTGLYKDNRAWLATAHYWQLPTSSASLIACGNVDREQQQALFSVVTVDSVQTTRAGHLQLRGLCADTQYRVQLLSINLEELTPFNKQFPTWCKQAIITSGELLLNIGVPLPVLPPQTALLIGCKQESTA